MRPEYEAVVARDLRDLRQAVLRFVELTVIEGLESRHAEQATVDAVRPSVVGAQEALGVAFLGAAYGVAPMRTGVEQSLDAAVFLPHHQHIVAAHDRLEEIAGLGNLRFVAEKQPGPRKDPLHLELEDRRIAIDTAVDLAPLQRNQFVDHSGWHAHADTSLKGCAAWRLRLSVASVSNASLSNKNASIDDCAAIW